MTDIKDYQKQVEEFRWTFKEYQDQAAITAEYPGIGSYPMGVMYAALGVAGEAGEVADQVKKTWRNDGKLTAERRAKILDEMGDNLWYLALLALELGEPLESVAAHNIEKLRKRAAKNEIKIHT